MQVKWAPQLMSGVSTCHLWRECSHSNGKQLCQRILRHGVWCNDAAGVLQYGAISVYSRELRCRFDCRFLRLKAAPAVKSHWRQPHFFPIRALTVGGLISSSSRRMLMAACILVLWDQKNVDCDCVRCLSGSNRRGTNEKMIPKRFFWAFFLSGERW